MKNRKTAILFALDLSVIAVFTACGGSAKDETLHAKTEGQTDAGDQTDSSCQ